MDAELAALVEAFTAKYPALASPAGADNQCQIAVDTLVEDLRCANRVARKVWFKGHRQPATRSPRGRAGEDVEHAAVLTGERLVVDVTRRQYEPDAGLPTVYFSAAECGEHWRFIQLDDARRGEYRVLPAPERAAPARQPHTNKRSAASSPLTVRQ